MSPKLKRNRKLEWIPIDRVIPNQNNPRAKQHFTGEELQSLQESIQEHGVLEPILVQPYRDGPKDDRYLLIEGERRYTVAKSIGLKEIPAVINSKLDDHDQLVVMYQVHTQRRGWEVAEQLRTIKQLMSRSAGKSEHEIAKELGMSLATLKNRLSVLRMGDDVVSDIARDKLDYSSALRVSEASSLLAKKRPEMVAKLGGEEAVERKLLDKAIKRKETSKGGLSQELVEAKKDLGNVHEVDDEAVESYIENPKTTITEVRRKTTSLVERRQAENLARDLNRVEQEIKSFDVSLAEVPNLRALRSALGTLMNAAGSLELRVVEAIQDEEEAPDRQAAVS